MRVGFFGGSFNPPTNAHINLAKSALDKCQLDKVIFMPIGDFYNKDNLAKATDRYQMLKIACKENERLDVSDLEVNIKKRLYAIDAFKLIEENYPNDELFFIMGADNFTNIINWKDANKLLSKYKYIVLERKNIDVNKYIDENEIIKKIRDNIYILSNEDYIKKSATNFRKLLKKKDTMCKKEISEEVYQYIIEKKLYG